MTDWIYADSDNNAVMRINADGALESCLASRPDVLDWVAQGNTISPFVPDVATVCAAIKDYRDQRLAAGFVDSVTGKTFQCDSDSRTSWDGLGAKAFRSVTKGSPSDQFPIRCADNSTLVLLAADADALFADRLAPWVAATMLYAGALQDATRAGNRPADYEQGWP